MHGEAHSFVARMAPLLRDRRRVLEIGSRNTNGTARPLFARPGVEYVGLDAAPGPGVDVVADASYWWPPGGRLFDLVVSTETLEHCPDPAAVCRTAFEVLAPGGALLLTAAAPPRAPHGAHGGALGPGEYYGNVAEVDLRTWLAGFAVVLIDVTTTPGDVYTLAFKGR